MNEIAAHLDILLRELFPICRSLTGAGIRETLTILQKELPREIKAVPSGTMAFDWTVPRAWNIHNAYIKNNRGEKVIHFQKSNLHVMSYSVPVNAKMSLEELRPHLFTLPEAPDLIPYGAQGHQSRQAAGYHPAAGRSA